MHQKGLHESAFYHIFKHREEKCNMKYSILNGKFPSLVESIERNNEVTAPPSPKIMKLFFLRPELPNRKELRHKLHKPIYFSMIENR